MAARYVQIGQYPDYRDEIRGTLLEILASTANPGTYAAPEDVAGCTLEMGASGWVGCLGVFASDAAMATATGGNYANLVAGGVTAKSAGVDKIYQDARAGWIPLPNDISDIRKYGALPDGSSDCYPAFLLAQTAYNAGVIPYIHLVNQDKKPITYWFGTEPNLANLTILADANITLSFPTENGTVLTTTTVKGSPFTILARDRNNSAVQYIDDDVITEIAANKQVQSIFPLNEIADSAVRKYKYSATNGSSTDVSGSITYDTASHTYQLSGLTESLASIVSLEIPVDVGYRFDAEMSLRTLDAAPNIYAGVVVSDSAANKLIVLGYEASFNQFTVGKYIGTGWSQASIYLPQPPANSSYTRKFTGRIGFRFLNATTIQLFHCGALVQVFKLPFTPTYAGLGGIIRNSAGKGFANFAIGSMVRSQVANGTSIGRPIAIDFFGDSIMRGEGAKTLAERIKKGITSGLGIPSVTVRNFGASGANAAGQLATMMAQSGYDSVDAAVIMIGANDAPQGVTTVSYEASLTSMVTYLKGQQPYMAIVIISHPPSINYADSAQGWNGANGGAMGGGLRQAAMRVAAANSVGYIDAESILGWISPAGWNIRTRDNLHLNNTAHQLLANAVVTAIRQQMTGEMV